MPMKREGLFDAEHGEGCRCRLLSFAPKYVRTMPFEAGEGKMPVAFEGHGTVLLVDICGYSDILGTALTFGDFGMERVNKEIGPIFNKAINIINHFGGDIIKFLGDALLVVFQSPNSNGADDSVPARSMTCPSADGSVCDFCCSAVACATRIIEELQGWTIKFERLESEYEQRMFASCAKMEPSQTGQIDSDPSIKDIREMPWDSGFLVAPATEITGDHPFPEVGQGSECPETRTVCEMILKIHASVASGKVVNLILGARNHIKDWRDVAEYESGTKQLEYCIGGKTVVDAAKGIDIASPGQLLIHKDMVAHGRCNR